MTANQKCKQWGPEFPVDGWVKQRLHLQFLGLPHRRWISVLRGFSHLKDAVCWQFVIPHYFYNLKERKVTFLKICFISGNMPESHYTSSLLILSIPDSYLARWAARKTSHISMSTDLSELQSIFAMPISMASVKQTELGTEAMILFTSFPKWPVSWLMLNEGPFSLPREHLLNPAGGQREGGKEAKMWGLFFFFLIWGIEILKFSFCLCFYNLYFIFVSVSINWLPKIGVLFPNRQVMLWPKWTQRHTELQNFHDNSVLSGRLSDP